MDPGDQGGPDERDRRDRVDHTEVRQERHAATEPAADDEVPRAARRADQGEAIARECVAAALPVTAREHDTPGRGDGDAHDLAARDAITEQRAEQRGEDRVGAHQRDRRRGRRQLERGDPCAEMDREQHARHHDQAALACGQSAQPAAVAPARTEQQDRGDPDTQRGDRERGSGLRPAHERRAGGDREDGEQEPRHYDDVVGLPSSSSTVSAIAIALRARATIASSVLIFWYARSTCSW